ncbi:photosystem I P700 apoprotein A2 [Tanacetum coccineum]|uniref:photosystem I n=1 Tax=Tanacetum coccineum TaxID=301880 RepID=A0ABQ5DW08_9ASTR
MIHHYIFHVNDTKYNMVFLLGMNVRARAAELNLASTESNLLEGRDVHIHFPAGAVPKDGPGVTLVTSLVLLFSQRRIRSDTAMTGEMTLRGLVLPVLAAHRYGLKRVILPERNLKDLVEVPAAILGSMEWLPVETTFKIMTPSTMPSVISAFKSSVSLTDTTPKEMANKDMNEEVWRLQATLIEQTEIIKSSQENHERLQNKYCDHGGIYHAIITSGPYITVGSGESECFGFQVIHKEAIISHLSWASLFLGFHTLGLYVHNDVMLAFGTLEKPILIEPIFAQWIQSAHGKTSYGFDILLSSTNGLAFNAGRSIWLPGWLNAINENSNSLFLTIGRGDFLVHHAIALGLHTTTLILVKGALDARGSKLMPDKKDFGYSFPCDGPGRGGTCDISAWDAFYLAVFWMLNTIGWVTFYWHWKHITLWQGNVSQFNESSTYLMGWLRDYLWLNSSQLINGYNPFGMNSLSVWAWMFLFGHLVWATGFMFLISWRGYWQELIETLAWAHERTPLANLIRWRDKPVALSIVQARLVGLAHFSVGYIFTYAAFLIASTSGKFG